MYGFGDVSSPNDQTVEIMEDLLFQVYFINY